MQSRQISQASGKGLEIGKIHTVPSIEAEGILKIKKKNLKIS